jgi:hypothetical protein
MSAARNRWAEATASMPVEHCSVCGGVLVWHDRTLTCPRLTWSCWGQQGNDRTQAPQAIRQSTHHGGDGER